MLTERTYDSAVFQVLIETLYEIKLNYGVY